MKRSPSCSKEYAESIGTVRWTLEPSNVEISDSIYIFQKGQFLTKMSFFSKRMVRSSSEFGVQMRETVLEKWISKKGGP